MLRDILWTKVNQFQLAGAAFGTFTGLIIMLFAVQTYMDIQQILFQNQTQEEGFLILNKKVSLLNTLGLGNSFSPEELELIQSQPFVSKSGPFTSNQYKVSASSRTMGFYTELFFESLPDEFVDAPSNEWFWEPNQSEIPILLSRDYLALYNFGFAPSQGLPQFTPGTIKKVSFEITVSGNGISKSFTGRIAGFSERINSILVPQEFMDWANQRLGSGAGKEPSRLIVKVSDPYSRELETFLRENGYELSSGKLVGGRLKFLVNLLFSISAGIGFLLLLLSMVISILSFQVLISRAGEKINLLYQLGYLPDSMSAYIFSQFLRLFFWVWMISVGLFLFLRYFSWKWMQSQGYEVQFIPALITFLVLACVSLAYIFFNRAAIWKTVKEFALG